MLVRTYLGRDVDIGIKLQWANAKYLQCPKIRIGWL